MEKKKVKPCSSDSSPDTQSTSAVSSATYDIVVLPEAQNPLEDAKKFVADLEKRKEKVKEKKERDENIQIASKILFPDGSEDLTPTEDVKKGISPLDEEETSEQPRVGGSTSIYPFCHTTVVEHQENYRTSKPELNTSNFNRNYITSPFVLKRFLGYDPEVYAKNMSKAKEFAILVTSGNLLLLYDYNSENHLTLQGHKNRIVTTSVDSKGNWIASSDLGPDSCVIIWDAIRCFPVNVIWEFNQIGCYHVKLSPCAKYLATITEKRNESNIKIISIWEWVHGEDRPDVSVEIDTNEFGKLKKIDFAYQECNFMLVTTEKKILFLTLEMVDGNKVLTFYHPKGLTKKSRLEMGIFNDSTYVKGSHMALTGTSTGQVVIWSDMAWNFFEDEPVRMLCNKKNAYLHMQLDRYSIELIYSVDEQVVTVNSKGMIIFYNQRLQVLYVMKELKGCNPAISLSFHIKKRSIEGSAVTFEEPSSAKGPLASKDPSEKILFWEKLKKEEYCYGRPGVLFETRDFIATTNTGDIVYVNHSHDEVHYILKNYMDGVTALGVHPKFDLLCLGTDSGKVFLYDFNQNDVPITTYLPVEEAIVKEFGAVTEDDLETVSLMNHITYLKYSPSGQYVACGTKSGDLWLLDGCSLCPVARIPRTTFPIVKIIFTEMNEYMAFHDSYSHMILMSSKNCPPAYIGKIRTHSKPIADMQFSSKGNDHYLYTLGLDRYFVEYIATECESLGFIKINVYLKIELLGKGTCMFPDPCSRMTMLVFTETGKCRFINLEKMHVYKTVQGPLLNKGLQFVQALGLPNQLEYLLFTSRNEMGLLMCPVDGNPYKWVSHTPTSEQIEHIAIGSHGKYVFCKGKNEYITMWEINTLPVSALEALGGKGADPYATLLAMDPRSPSLQDVQDMFFYCQVSHKGLYNIRSYDPTDKITACGIPSAFRALGYFMTNYEEDLLIDELVGESNLKLSEIEVSFEDFIKIFVNHKVNRLSEPQMKGAFYDICKSILPESYTPGPDALGIPIQDFLYYLQNYGDKFDPCLSYIYLRSLIEPFTKEIEEEMLDKIELGKQYPYIDNKYYEFMPEMITYEYFKTVIMGLKDNFNEKFKLPDHPLFVGD